MEMTRHKEIVLRVGDIYKWLDEQCIAHVAKAGGCKICGKCCDLEAYGHRLYVTTPEMLYFSDKVGSRNIKQIIAGRCCYQVEGKCTVYPYRFAGCRIFCCKGDAGFQSELTETTVKKFKLLCEEFRIPYRYVDLPTALSTFSPPHT
jgi:Fe-S-cluster containining protein